MLARTTGVTPLYLRYNSGLHISQNGRALAALLDRLIEQHPGIDRLTLVGHSMGALIARSAGHYAGAGSGWTWPTPTSTSTCAASWPEHWPWWKYGCRDAPARAKMRG